MGRGKPASRAGGESNDRNQSYFRFRQVLPINQSLDIYSYSTAVLRLMSDGMVLARCRFPGCQLGNGKGDFGREYLDAVSIRGTPLPMNRRPLKLQAPTSKLQRSTKHQTSCAVRVRACQKCGCRLPVGEPKLGLPSRQPVSATVSQLRGFRGSMREMFIRGNLSPGAARESMRWRFVRLYSRGTWWGK